MTLVQKRLVSLGVLVLVAAGVVAFIVWSERDKVRDQEQSDKEARLFTIEKAKHVTTVKLTSRAGAFTMMREGEGWVLTEPFRTPADAPVVDAIVEHAVAMKRTGNVEVDGKPPASSELGLYGLAEPRFVLSLATGAGEPQVIDIGKKNDFSGALYAKRQGSDVVALVPGALEYQVDKSLFDLREKRMLTATPEQMKSVSVRRGDKLAYTVDKLDSGWMITAPKGMRADETAVTGVTSALANVRAVQFVSEHATPEKLAAHGLVKPALRVEVTLADGKKKVLLVGEVTSAKASEPHYYAALDGEPSPIVETSGEWIMRKVAVDAEALRDLRVLVFTREDVGEIELARGEESVRLVKRADWMVAGAADASTPERKADTNEVTGLLYTLFTLKAQRVAKDDLTAEEATKLGMDQPQLTITLRKADGGELGTLVVASDGELGTRAMVRGGSRLDVLEASDVEGISAKPEDYLAEGEQPAAPAQTPTAEKG